MITALIIFIILILSFVSFVYMQNNDIPGPLRVPFIGTLRFCTTKPDEFINLLRYFKDTYGDAYITYMFNTPTVFLSHPKYIMPLVLKSELATKGDPYKLLYDWLGTGLLTAQGEKWKTFRKLLTPAIHFNLLPAMMSVFLKNNKILIEKFKKHLDGKPFDLFPIIVLTSLDNITESIMGISVNAQMNTESEYVKSINEVSRIVALRYQNPIVGNDIFFKFMSIKKIYDRYIENIHGTIRNIIQMRRQALVDNDVDNLDNDDEFGTKNKYGFIDLLLLSKINGRNIEDEHIREQVDTFMFAGHDTTTSALIFTLYCISLHADVQEKILDEQRNILNGELKRDPEYAELQQMKYLETVIKESMRIYPPVPMIQKTIIKDCELGGLSFKKNTSVLIDVLQMQRHPDVFTDPLEFRPERFDTSQLDAGVNNWLAFSAGPRNCIGQKFAMLEIKVILSSIVKHFKILPVRQEIKLCSELVLRSYNGVKIRVEQR